MGKLRILMVCAEYVPMAKTGGLADAVAGLAATLAASGHDVRVLLPNYGRQLVSSVASVPEPSDASPGAGSDSQLLSVNVGEPGPQIYLLDSALFDHRAIYCGDERDAARFLSLADAAPRLCRALNWPPDIIHAHDWHAAFAPLFLAASFDIDDFFSASRSVLTIHNAGFQGIFPDLVLQTGPYAKLRALLSETDRAHGMVNFLRSGIMHANELVAVSLSYAREIQTAEFGMGLEDIFKSKNDRLTGILNGVDYAHWDPQTDPLTVANYGPEDLAGKRANRLALREQLGMGLGEPEPLIGVVSRLTEQKGIDLLIEALPALLSRQSCGFALIGDGARRFSEPLKALAKTHPNRISVTIGHDEVLAHRVFAGSDMFLMPSRYEPCGLTQLYALRYGTIPIVRRTGGLADTVAHFDSESRLGTGVVFEHANVAGLTWAISQALTWFADSDKWQRLIRNAMAADFSWARQAPLYEALYERALNRPADC